MSENILEVQDLEIRYVTDEETVRAVNDISFSLKEGESIGLVGETGAGKTTTALGIMGLVPDPPGEVVGGSIVFDGQDLLKLPEKQMREISADMRDNFWRSSWKKLGRFRLKVQNLPGSRLKKEEK